MIGKEDTPFVCEQAIPALISHVATFLPMIKRMEELLDRKIGHRFCAFDLFNTSENYSSVVLAFLLDPKGSHGQSTLFLKLFLERFVPQFPRMALAEAVLEREHMTRAGRRLDLLVILGQCRIGIENKFKGAQDQDGQVNDYLSYLEDLCQESLLIYLAPRAGHPPSENSVTRQNGNLPPQLVLAGWVPAGEEEVADPSSPNPCGKGIEAMPYRTPLPDVVSWLDACALHCPAANVRWFIEQFRKHVIGTVTGSYEEDSMEEDLVVLGMIKNSPVSLEAALRIGSALPQLKKTIWQEFLICLKDKLVELANNLNTGTIKDYQVMSNYMGDWWDTPEEKWHVIMLRRPCWPTATGVAISSERSNCEEIIIGFLSPTSDMWQKDKDSEKYYGKIGIGFYSNELLETISRQLKENMPRRDSIRSSPWWPCYFPMADWEGRPLKNWNTEEGLLLLFKGKVQLADHVVGLFKRVVESLPDEVLRCNADAEPELTTGSHERSQPVR